MMISRVLVATSLGFLPFGAKAVDIDLSSARISISGANSIYLESVTAGGQKYWAAFTWDGGTNSFIIESYGVYDNELARRLLGSWVFTYTETKTYSETYHLTTVAESEDNPGEYYVRGSDQDGNVATAHYDFGLQSFTLLEPGFNFDHFFAFHFTSDSNVEGCYHRVRSGSLSDCYPMTGYRTAGSSSMAKQGRAGIQAPLEAQKAYERLSRELNQGNRINWD
jgi:hypothetical protein